MENQLKEQASNNRKRRKEQLERNNLTSKEAKKYW